MCQFRKYGEYSLHVQDEICDAEYYEGRLLQHHLQDYDSQFVLFAIHTYGILHF
jgi:hypothetical protein